MPRLGEAFGWSDNPFYQAFDANRNSIVGGLTNMGADPLNPWKGFGQGVQQGAKLDMYAAEKQAEQEQTNQTAEWLKANYPQFAGLPPAEGFRAAMAEMSNAQSAATADPASWREWQHFSGLPKDQQAAYLRMKRASPYLNTGTEFVQPDPVNPGQVSGSPIAIDNYTPAYDKGLGAGMGGTDAETIAAAQSLDSKMPGLRSVVGELGQLAQTATYTVTGQVIDNAMREAGMEPSEAAVARTKYMAMVDNQVLPLLRDTFGAAFTVQEGEALRATLGAPDKSPAEKQVVLEAFIEQKERDLKALQSRLPGATGGAPAAGQQPGSIPPGVTIRQIQ